MLKSNELKCKKGCYIIQPDEKQRFCQSICSQHVDTTIDKTGGLPMEVCNRPKDFIRKVINMRKMAKPGEWIEQRYYKRGKNNGYYGEVLPVLF
jgi:hypothetical protein